MRRGSPMRAAVLLGRADGQERTFVIESRRLPQRANDSTLLLSSAEATSDPRATVADHAERTSAAVEAGAEATQAGGEAPELPPVARWRGDRVGATEECP